MSRDEPASAFVRKAEAAVADHQMIRAGDRIVVGLSGGADSVALLHFLVRWAAQRPDCGVAVCAAHLNHHLRGEESDRDEYFVRDLCRWLEVPLTVEWRPVKELSNEKGQSVELCAREERYAFFQRIGGKTATAHTLDDSAETVLLNFARGTGLRGLCGIPPVRDNIIRPLLGCSRAEVEAYCAENKLGFVVDSSNLSDDYTRNRLRHRVMPVLREINPAFPRGVAGMCHSLRADADYLDGLAAHAVEELVRADHQWDAIGLAALPGPIRGRVLQQLLALHGVPQERRRVEQLEAVLRGSGAVQLSGNWSCRCRHGVLEFFAAGCASEQGFLPAELRRPFHSARVSVFWDKLLVVNAVNRANFEENINILTNGFKNALDCAKIDRIVTIRCRAPGDAIRLAGRGCTKKLKKLFQEAGIGAEQRARTLVLADTNNQPLWVEGFGVSEAAQANRDTERLLLLDVECV